MIKSSINYYDKNLNNQHNKLIMEQIKEAKEFLTESKKGITYGSIRYVTAYECIELMQQFAEYYHKEEMKKDGVIFCPECSSAKIDQFTDCNVCITCEHEF